MTANEISGNVRLSGLIVQARDIPGGVHRHAAVQPHEEALRQRSLANRR
ncbi:hypothetical protein AB0942_28755 [Streptomyces nodosus]